MRRAREKREAEERELEKLREKERIRCVGPWGIQRVLLGFWVVRDVRERERSRCEGA